MHRHDGMVEIALRLRIGGAALRFEGVGVQVGAAKALYGGDQVCANALGHKSRLHIGFGVLRPSTAVRANGYAAHAFDTTSHHQVFPARAHFLRRHVHGLQAGCTKAVDLHASALKVPTGLERCHLGDHAALLAYGRDHAHHHIVHHGGIKLVALLQVAEQT